ncbi:MAG: efflux RND transporter periplasmic adaptor subunit [Casimicrobiaceae bacterium]|nr:efflux RND transporter periplasmic adaptor subunit [Casimicrobiaceae bacterium]MDW8312311.1 efflux RND transporter periplasmic adaptor subunit [Burkholderiales bacterium]
MSKLSMLMRRLGRWWPVWLTLLLIIGAAVYFRWRGTEVAVEAARSEPLRQTLVFSARVAAPARVEVASTLTARVEAVEAREADRVRRGQTLIRLDARDLQAQVAQARAQLAAAQTRLRAQGSVQAPAAEQGLAQARANVAFARAELERLRSLEARGFIGAARVQEAERALAVAEATERQAAIQAAAQAERGPEAAALAARVEEARAALALAESRLAQTRILSPVDGRVVARAVEVGEVVQPGRRLMTLAADGPTRLIAQIDEKNLALVREGIEATAASDAFPNERFRARVQLVAAAADPQRGTIEVWLEVPEPPAYLREAMTVSVEVVAGEKPQAIVVPVRALREAGGEGPRVLVLEEGRAVERPVRTGLRTAQWVEILEGVRAGEPVILEAAVAPGARVRPREALPASAAVKRP